LGGIGWRHRVNIEIPEGTSKNIDYGVRMRLGRVVHMNWKLVKRITLLCVGFHTLYVLFVFGFVHFHKTAQDVMYWFMFFPGADDPLVTLGFTIDRELFHFTAPLTALWYNLGFSGLNMRSGLIYLLFGGTQWAVWGFALGCAIVGIKEKIAKRHEPAQQSACSRRDELGM
jgi:hypothetical protein